MQNIPKIIYLQIDADGEIPEDFSSLEVSWCTDKIHESDIRYIQCSDADFPFTTQLIQQRIDSVSRELKDTITTLDHLKKTIPEGDWDGCIQNIQSELAELKTVLEIIKQTV